MQHSVPLRLLAVAITLMSRLEEELLQLTDKSKVQKKNIVDSQTKYAVDTEKLRKKLSDLQSELLAKTDEVTHYAYFNTFNTKI